MGIFRQYDIIDKIGEGKYGEVFKVVHRKTRKLQVKILGLKISDSLLPFVCAIDPEFLPTTYFFSRLERKKSLLDPLAWKKGRRRGGGKERAKSRSAFP